MFVKQGPIFINMELISFLSSALEGWGTTKQLLMSRNFLQYRVCTKKLIQKKAGLWERKSKAAGYDPPRPFPLIEENGRKETVDGPTSPSVDGRLVHHIAIIPQIQLGIFAPSSVLTTARWQPSRQRRRFGPWEHLFSYSRKPYRVLQIFTFSIKLSRKQYPFIKPAPGNFPEPGNSSAPAAFQYQLKRNAGSSKRWLMFYPDTRFCVIAGNQAFQASQPLLLSKPPLKSFDLESLVA